MDSSFAVTLLMIGIGAVALFFGLMIAIATNQRNKQSATTPTTPAGWHPDPYGKHQLRYFDGTSWREMVSDDGVQSVDAPPPPTL